MRAVLAALVAVGGSRLFVPGGAYVQPAEPSVQAAAQSPEYAAQPLAQALPVQGSLRRVVLSEGTAERAAGAERPTAPRVLSFFGGLALGLGAVAALTISGGASRGSEAKVDKGSKEPLPKYFDYVHELETMQPRQNGVKDPVAKTSTEQREKVDAERYGTTNGLTPWYDLSRSPGGGGLDAAYEQCRDITERYSKTFYLATVLMPKERASAFWAVYAWCRRTDDLVDMPRLKGDNNLREELIDWEDRLNEAFAGRPRDVIDAALTDTVVRFPSLTVEPFEDMIKGMVMDVPGTGQNRYATWDELNLYCYRVAGTVGLMSVPIFGTADGYTEADAREAALSLGVALQITNILRDVGEDARRGRIYLPQEDMERFGVTEEQIMDGIVDDKYKALMQFEIDRAEGYYKAAQSGIAMLSSVARFPTQAALEIYRQILFRLVENDYDNLTKRAYVSKTEKFSMLPGIWWKSFTSQPEAFAAPPEMGKANFSRPDA